MTRYKITIEKTEVEEVTLGKRWLKMREKPDAVGETYGYTPETTSDEEKTREVYTQIVTTLDLPTVIAAVNKMTVIIGVDLAAPSPLPPPVAVGWLVIKEDQHEALLKAVEFGEYLAKTSEQFMQVLTDRQADEVGEMWGSLRMAIFDFRKRVDSIG